VLDIAAAPFGPGMLHGAVAFALFGFAIGLLEGYFTGIIRSQRDELAQQLEINRAYRDELEAKNSALCELEQENRRMTRFLIHDLKNHVGCVLGYTKLLLKRARENEWQQRDQNVLTTVIRQAERMNGAVCDVLEQARLEHRPWIHLQPAQATDILCDARESVALNPGEGRVRIGLDAPEDLLVTCKPRWIVRVFANLVLNAVRHNPRGVQVTIGAKRWDKEAVFFCTDDGKGIPRSIRHRVFEEFTCETKTNEPVPSFGLGLSFCKAAVEAQGGRIWFETARGAGTTFFFSLPVAGGSCSQNGKAFKVVDRDRAVTVETSQWYADRPGPGA
jgi:K+-sensing histidine kinase KdpD